MAHTTHDMQVTELDTNLCLTTTIHNPYPSRYKSAELPLSERQCPLAFKCDKCQTEISFRLADLERHCNSEFTNLDADSNSQFAKYIGANDLGRLSFLDFYCPNCEQPTKILFHCGPSGYWGAFYFEIEKVLVIKPIKDQ